MEDMVTEAINKNMKSICFTDHVEFEVTEKKLDLAFNTKDYFRKINQVKYKYMNKIEILCGVELGMKPHLYKNTMNSYHKILFDFRVDVHAFYRRKGHVFRQLSQRYKAN